jgi:hypothetical protein
VFCLLMLNGARCNTCCHTAARLGLLFLLCCATGNRVPGSIKHLNTADP